MGAKKAPSEQGPERGKEERACAGGQGKARQTCVKQELFPTRMGPARRSHALLTPTLPRLLARRCPGKLRLSPRSPSGPRPRFASSGDRGKLSPVALPPGELISKNRESVGRRRLPRNQRGLYSRLGCGKTNCSVFDAEAWRKEKKHYGRLAANLDRSQPARGEGVDPLPHVVRCSGLIAVVTSELRSGPRRGRERGRQWGDHDRSKSR